MDGQGIKRRRNTAENFNLLSRAHERYRRQTDRQTTYGRTMTYSEREREFTFAKNDDISCTVFQQPLNDGLRMIFRWSAPLRQFFASPPKTVDVGVDTTDWHMMSHVVKPINPLAQMWIPQQLRVWATAASAAWLITDLYHVQRPLLLTTSSVSLNPGRTTNSRPVRRYGRCRRSADAVIAHDRSR